MIKTSIIIPAYNEEKGIKSVLNAILDVIDETYEVIVVDDGSTDATPRIAAEFKVKLIRHKRNQGKGAALKTGLKHATGEYVVFIDADGTYPASGIPRIVRYLDNGYDVVTGSRLMGEIEGMSLLNKAGNCLISGLLRFFYNSNTTDPLSGLRGIKKTHLRRMELISDGFEVETEFTIKSSVMNLRSIDFPIHYRERIGETKLKPLGDGYIIIRTLINFISVYLPGVFLVPGSLFFVLGVALTILLMGGPIEIGRITLGPQTMLLGSLCVIGGFQLLLLGISSKMFSVIHGFSKMDALTRWLLNRDLVLTGIFPGIMLSFIGFLVGLRVVALWVKTGFGVIREFGSVAIAITFIILGFQLLFSGLFLGMFLRELSRKEVL
jgi:hypothetical protein